MQRQSTLSGCLHPASSQMFCGLLCKPTCICLLAFQNVWYHCIHYGLSSWPPTQHVLCSGMAGILFFKGRSGSLLKCKAAISCINMATVLRVYISMLYPALGGREMYLQLLDTNGKCVCRRQTLECKKKTIRKPATEELNKVSPLITAARAGLRQEKP